MEGVMLLWIIAALMAGYLCGSIPFGLLIGKAGGKGDIRTIGSGNIGATNVLRTGSRKLAALTLLADMLKGTVPTLLAYTVAGLPAAIAAGMGALLGHLFPLWLGFRGGKGVATYLGVLLALAWQGAIAFAVTWLAVAALMRFSSLAALTAMIVVPAVLYLFGETLLAIVFIVMGAIVAARHHANIGRLINGTESRIGAQD